MTTLFDRKRIRRVVLIDDVAIDAIEYQTSLQLFAQWPVSVEVAIGVTEAMIALRSGSPVDLFVIDLSMAPGLEFGPNETCGGKHTGILVAREARRMFPDTPIILLSGSPFAEVIDAGITAQARVQNCVFCEKHRYPPRRLAKLLDQLFSTGVVRGVGRSAFQRIWSGVIMQPNVAGFGYDLKAIDFA